MASKQNETEVGQDIQKALAFLRCKVWRNNSGAFENAAGRWVRFGLGNISEKLNKVFKTSDYVGYTTIEVTQEMVGRKLAVFSAVEIKKPEWEYTGTEDEVAQKTFIDLVIRDGGFATFAKSVDEALKYFNLCTKRSN